MSIVKIGFIENYSKKLTRTTENFDFITLELDLKAKTCYPDKW